MSGDPFANLTDTRQDRKERDGRLRKQRWTAFWAALGATVLVAVAAGLGAAGGGWPASRDTSAALDRLLGGAVYGLAGGVFFFLGALWRVMRRSVINEVFGTPEDIDVGAVLFWATVAGTAIFGTIGAAVGLAGQSAMRPGVLIGAVGATLLALIPAALVRRATRRQSRTGSGPLTYRTRG